MGLVTEIIEDNESSDLSSFNFLEDSQDYEIWLVTVMNSVVYRDKSLQEWEAFLNLPDASASINPDEVEKFNNKLINLTEIVMSNTAYSKVAYLKAEAAHKEAMLKERSKILTELEGSIKRAPSADSMEKMCEHRCIKSFKILESSRAIYEFWNTHSYKLNRLHDRMTSLNILKKTGY